MLRNIEASFLQKTFAIIIAGFIAAVVISIAGASTTFAATKTWTGGGGDSNFNTSGNWSPSGAPSNGDNIVINNTGGSVLTLTNNISSLSLSGILISGTKGVSITSSSALTLTGPVTSTNTDPLLQPYINGNIVLGGNVTVTNVGLSNTSTTDTLALGGYTLTLITDDVYTDATYTFTKQVTGTGQVDIDVRNAVSIFFGNTNTYSGITNLISGQTATLEDDANDMFGSSTINVSATAGLSLKANGASWTFDNPINFAGAVVGQSGFLEAQLYLWSSQSGQTMNIPNITLNGDARFDLNDLGNSNVIVNLAGITANGHCVQYGNNNSSADDFQNGPAACYIGNENSPNTAAHLIFGNPLVVIALGVVSASLLVGLALRIRTSKL